MAERVEKDSAESLVPSHFDNDNVSSNSDDSLIQPVRLTTSGRRIISSSGREFGENSATAIEGWEEVFQDTDNPPEAHHKFQEIPGPKHTLPRAAAPIAYFYLFFTDILLETIVNKTNAYADNVLSRRNLHPNSRARKWKDITIPELKAFIACIINMGLQKRPSISSYWSTNDSQYNPWFHRMFSRNRFQLILKFLHLADTRDLPRPGQPGYDPCAKIQPLIDHANTIFRQLYAPHEQMSIDKSLVGTKNHTELLQYLPNKHHHRWGIKLWMLRDSVSEYCLAFHIYRGAQSAADRLEIQQNGLAHTVVMKLLTMGNYFSKGYHIFVDDFFTSIPLAKALYDLGTYITGTIRRNRKFLPKSLTEKFGVGITKYFRQGPILTIGYREKKSQRVPVILLSSKSKAEGTTHFRTRRGQTEETVKPFVVECYNNYTGGIDTSDMMLYTYLDERRTVKYWKKYASMYFRE